MTKSNRPLLYNAGFRWKPECYSGSVLVDSLTGSYCTSSYRGITNGEQLASDNLVRKSKTKHSLGWHFPQRDLHLHCGRPFSALAKRTSPPVVLVDEAARRIASSGVGTFQCGRGPNRS